jgi:hypothetical protein
MGGVGAQHRRWELSTLSKSEHNWRQTDPCSNSFANFHALGSGGKSGGRRHRRDRSDAEVHRVVGRKYLAWRCPRDRTAGAFRLVGFARVFVQWEDGLLRFRREFSFYAWPAVLDAPERIALSPDSEFLICRERIFDDLQVSVRTHEPDGTEHLVGTSTVFRHKQAEKLAQSITQRTGFPVRLCERQRDATGEHEKEWDTDWDRRHLRELLYSVPAGLLPYSGFVVRALTANTGIVIAAGVLLMALEGVLVWRAGPPSSSESNRKSVWTFSLLLALFPIPYTLSVLLTPVLIAHRLK